MYRGYFKPFFDFCLSLLGFIVLLPLFLMVLALLAIANKGRVFFVQQRPGKNGRIFRLIKFKTMNDARDTNGNLLPDAQRLTPVGKFVRETSLDEIPQLLNVIKGDMSLVGPRPLLVEYLPLYSAEQARRHEVRPGITGWAQVNGRNSISWKEKFSLDVWYVDNLSFLIDSKIIFLTLRNVIKREGITKEGFATTEAFNGKN
jgi:lipopolysaccharide/colanic/teichoic acid biosynthesis glycosyltransferase